MHGMVACEMLMENFQCQTITHIFNSAKVLNYQIFYYHSYGGISHDNKITRFECEKKDLISQMNEKEKLSECDRVG